MDKALPEPSGEKLDGWLNSLCLLRDLTGDLMNEISSFQIPDFNPENVMNVLFSEYVEEYSDREIRWLASIYRSRLQEYQQVLQPEVSAM